MSITKEKANSRYKCQRHSDLGVWSEVSAAEQMECGYYLIQEVSVSMAVLFHCKGGTCPVGNEKAKEHHFK